MEYMEYGKENSETILLLHGGGLSWWNYDNVAKALRDEYHVILPILDGHAESDAPFTTVEQNAREIIRYIDGHCGGSVLLIGGLSLGGQVLLEMLSQRKDICKYAIIESASVRPSRLMCTLVRPAIGCSYGLVKRRWFSRLQFRSLRLREDLFECYYTDTSDITRENMIAFIEASAGYSLNEDIRACEAEVHVYVGSRERRSVRKSAEDIRRALPAATLHVLPRLYHGEFSIKHADDYAAAIRKIVGDQSDFRPAKG